MPVNYAVTYGTTRPRTYSRHGAACFAALQTPYPWVSRSRRAIVRVDYTPREFLRTEEARKASIDICTWAKDIVPEIIPYYEWLLKHKVTDRLNLAPPVSIDTTKRSGAYMLVAFSYARLGQTGLAPAYMLFRAKYGLSVPRALAFAANFCKLDTELYRYMAVSYDSFVETYCQDMPKNLGKVQERETLLTEGGAKNTYAQVKKYRWRVGEQVIGPDYMFTGAVTLINRYENHRINVATMTKIINNVVDKGLFLDYRYYFKKKGMDALVNSDALFSFD